MTECETFQGQFKDWKPDQKVSLITDLTNIINSVKLYGFGSSVDIPLFRTVFPGEPEEALYFLCFRHCVSQMAWWAAGVNQTAAFVFDQNKQFAHRAHALFDRLAATPSSYQRGFGTLTFADRRKFVPLQAADLIAYETYKAAHHAVHDTTRPLRKSVRNVARSRRLFVRDWDENILRALRKKMEEDHHSSLMEWMLTKEFMEFSPERRA